MSVAPRAGRWVLEDRGSRAQAGIVLIEAVIALLLITLVLLALFSALTTILVSSSLNRRTVRAGNELTSASEVTRGLSYVNCEGAGAMESRLLSGPNSYAPPSGYSIDVVSVRYLDDLGSSAPAFISTCPGSGDKGVQQIRLRIESAGAPVLHEELEFLKRRDTCPSSGYAPGERC